MFDTNRRTIAIDSWKMDRINIAHQLNITDQRLF